MGSRRETPDLVAQIDAPNVLDELFGTAPSGREMIPVKAIKVDGGTQMRATINPATVAEYCQEMAAGRKFPPIVLYYDGQAYWLADGFHRVAAHKQAYGQPGSAYSELSKPDILAEVRAGTRRDAVLYAAGANASHGLRRTNEDKRRAVMALLEDAEWSQLSDGEIARRCAVSQPFVGSLRPRQKPEATHNGYESTQEPVVRKGADGRTINTAKIGTNQPTYAQVYELESAIRAFGNITAQELREAARKGDGYMFWSRIRDAVDAKSLRWRKADLTQALNNVAAQMEAKANGTNSPNLGTGVAPSANTVHWGSLREIEGFICEWQHSGQRDVSSNFMNIGNEDALIGEIIAEATRRNVTVNKGTAGVALQNARNLLVSEKARAARQAQREETPAITPAPATTDKPMVEWTEAEWEAAEDIAKAQDDDRLALNAARRDQAIDILETYRQVVRTEKQYSELTGDFVGTIPVIEGMRKMIRGLESLIEALA